VGGTTHQTAASDIEMKLQVLFTLDQLYEWVGQRRTPNISSIVTLPASGAGCERVSCLVRVCCECVQCRSRHGERRNTWIRVVKSPTSSSPPGQQFQLSAVPLERAGTQWIYPALDVRSHHQP